MQNTSLLPLHLPRLVFTTACLLLVLFSARSQTDHQTPEGLLFPPNNGAFGSRGALQFGLESPLLVDSSFTLSFDLSIRGVGTFGYVVRLADGEDRDLTLGYSPARDLSDSAMLTLSSESEPTPLTLRIPATELGRTRWGEVSICCDRRSGATSLRHGSRIVSTSGRSYLQGDRIRVYFGYTPESQEVPPMGVRRVRLTNVMRDGGTPHADYAWDLGQVEGDDVCPSTGEANGLQRDCRWFASSMVEWTLEAEVLMEGPETAAFDEKLGRVFLLNRGQLSEFDLGQGWWRSPPYVLGLPAKFGHLKALYSERAGKVLIYHNGTGEVSSFTPDSGVWSPIDSSLDHNREYYNHAAFQDPATGALYAFGGYGWYTARNALLKYNEVTKRWEEVQTAGREKPEPRFSPMMARADSAGRWWMVGGTGNRSGRQEARYQKFRDLWELDLSGPSWRVVRDSLPFPEGFLPVWMATVEGDRRIFLLGWSASSDSGSFRFLGIDMGTWSVQEFAAPEASPIRSDALGMWYDREHRLFVSVFHVVVGEVHEFAVYTIPYPPSEPLAATRWPSWVAKVGIALAGILATAVLLYGFYRRRRPGIGVNEAVADMPGAPLPDAVALPSASVDSVSRPAITVFGKFRLVDARSQDRGDDLPPKLRELFLYLLLHSTSSKGRAPGVTTGELTAALWPEHDARAAKNIRGVSVKRLREFLREVGDISVVQTDSRWRIEAGDGATSDFQELMSLLQDPRSELFRGERSPMERFAKVASAGSLLAGEDFPWLEAIRADVSRGIVGMVVMLLRDGRRPIPPETVVSIAEVGLCHEPVNEELLTYRIKALVSLGRHGAARMAYDSFAAEFAEIAGRPFPRTFHECSF